MYIYFYLFDPKQELKDHRRPASARNNLTEQQTVAQGKRAHHGADRLGYDDMCGRAHGWSGGYDRLGADTIAVEDEMEHRKLICN